MCAIDWGPLGCASNATPDDGTHPGDSAGDSASVRDDLTCSVLPIGVATNVNVIGEVSHNVVSCDSDGETWCGGRSSCFAKQSVSSGGTEPLAVDGISTVSCSDFSNNVLADCDAVTTYENDVLTISKPTAGYVNVTMRIADKRYADATQNLRFTFSETPGCDTVIDIDASADATNEAASDASDDTTDAGASSDAEAGD
jgi:hypothetical protein